MQIFVDLDSMFESKQNIQTLLLAQIALGEAAVEIPKLSGPNGVQCIHLGHCAIRRLPSLRGSTLHQENKCMYENINVAFYLVNQLMLKPLHVAHCGAHKRRLLTN